jgi:hypothetical protein
MDRDPHPVPDSREYLAAWALSAAENMARAEKHFAEHVRAGIAAGIPGTGPLGQVIPAGVARGWLRRSEAIDLVLTALSTATRPSDHRAWLVVWLNDLGGTDQQIVDRADIMIPLLATGAPGIVTRLAPVLVAGVSTDRLADTVAAALSARTARARRAVLTALADRVAHDPAAAAAVAPGLATLTTTHDETLAAAVQRVLEAGRMATASTPG